jgi:SAM-dependent methyltransferase
MPNEDAEEKWNKIYTAKEIPEHIEAKAANVLQDHADLLPTSGIALDLACGLGGNAIFLAQQGLKTHAWDISQAAIEKLLSYCRGYCQSHGNGETISLTPEVRDVEAYPPEINTFDVICVSYYLQRALSKDIMEALKPNGLLFYQTFVEEKVSDSGPSNPKYRLQPNELLSLFSPLHVLAYQEYGIVGNVKKGLRDVAILVAQKR